MDTTQHLAAQLLDDLFGDIERHAALIDPEHPGLAALAVIATIEPMLLVLHRDTPESLEAGQRRMGGVCA